MDSVHIRWLSILMNARYLLIMARSSNPTPLRESSQMKSTAVLMWEGEWDWEESKNSKSLMTRCLPRLKTFLNSESIRMKRKPNYPRKRNHRHCLAATSAVLIAVNYFVPTALWTSIKPKMVNGIMADGDIVICVPALLWNETAATVKPFIQRKRLMK